MKKTLLLLLTLVLLVGVFVLPFHATVHLLCLCGRETASADGNGYMIYDCLGCGRNYTSCTCHTCWCGSSVERFTDGEGLHLTCEDCGLPCEDCVCRDRSYYDALLTVTQGLTGVDVPNPNNGTLVAVACFIPFAVFVLLYYTVYRRRSSSARKNRVPRVERELDKIDRISEPAARYALAKSTEETLRANENYSLREVRMISLRKNEVLPLALETDWIRDTAAENLRACRNSNSLGLYGAPELVDLQWDPRKGDFSEHRLQICAQTPAEYVTAWDSTDPKIALFEMVTPLNGRENNLLPPLSSVSRYTTRIFDKEPLSHQMTDPSTEEDRINTLKELVPDGDIEALLRLPERQGEPRKAPAGLPSETPRRMGDKNRFPGGTAK